MLRAAWIQAVDSAMDGSNDSRATAALKGPPGHHTTFETANGFCLMDFAAVAAIHAMERTLI
jgi:acetoin utilization deacetylase AcuC-like enzyme